MKYSGLVYVIMVAITFSSCVSTKKYKEIDTAYQETKKTATECSASLEKDEAQVNQLTNEKNALQTELDNLNQELDTVNRHYAQALSTMRDLSVLSGRQAENIQTSMETIHAKEAYINSLSDAARRRDSLNTELLMNFKDAMNSIADTGVSIRVSKGEMGIDIKDEILFAKDSNAIGDGGKIVLGKLARVLNQYPDMKFMVECRAEKDSVSDSTALLPDAWELSSKRAASVARVFETSYNISPARMALIGQSVPVSTAANNTAYANAFIDKTTILITAQSPLFYGAQTRQ